MGVGVGALAYLAISGKGSRARAAWGLLFAYGLVATFMGVLLLFTFHIHSISLSGIHVHIHEASTSVQDASTTEVAFAILVAATAVFGTAFALNQVSFRRMAARAQRVADPSETERLRRLCPGSDTLVVVKDSEAAAFCFALLKRAPGRLRPTGHEFLVMTTGLTEQMDDAMLRGIAEHERAHVRAHDSRYLPVVRATRRLMFFDPLYKWIERRFEVEREFAADREAVRVTGDPRALARALLAALEIGVTQRNRSCGLVGGCGRDVVVRRIETLIEMAEKQEKGKPRA